MYNIPVPWILWVFFNRALFDCQVSELHWQTCGALICISSEFLKMSPLRRKEKKLSGLQSFCDAYQVCVCSLSTLLDIYSIFVSIYILLYVRTYIYILPQLINSIGVGCSKLPNSQLCWNFFHHPRPVPGVVPARPAKVKSSNQSIFQGENVDVYCEK